MPKANIRLCPASRERSVMRDKCVIQIMRIMSHGVVTRGTPRIRLVCPEDLRLAAGRGKTAISALSGSPL